MTVTKPKIIEYSIYLHGDKSSARDAAEAAGFSEEEIEHYGLVYAGYEHEMKVVVNTETGKVIERSAHEVIVKD